MCVVVNVLPRVFLVKIYRVFVWRGSMWCNKYSNEEEVRRCEVGGNLFGGSEVLQQGVSSRGVVGWHLQRENV